MKSLDIVTTTLRLPQWLDDKLKKESEYKAISKNALILEKLRESINSEELRRVEKS